MSDKPMTKTRVNWDNAVKLANDICSGVHAEANRNPAVRGQGEVDFIAACVIAAKFYADYIGAPPEQTKELIKRIADTEIAMRLQPQGTA